MKQYQEIPYYGDYWGLPIIAFDKLDASNLRFKWSKKRGFYKYGTMGMPSKGNQLFYCKIKSNNWFDRLRLRYPLLYQKELKDHNLSQ